MTNLVLVRFHVRDGLEQPVEQILLEMVGKTRLEPGCQCYDLLQTNVDGRRIFVLLERYRDTAALEAHRASEHYKNYRANIMDHLTVPPEVTVLEGLDVRSF